MSIPEDRRNLEAPIAVARASRPCPSAGPRRKATIGLRFASNDGRNLRGATTETRPSGNRVPLREVSAVNHRRAASRGDLRFLQNLAYLVPGYRGYQDAALRRGEDSRLRARVLAAAKALRAEIDGVRGRWEAVDVEARWLQSLNTCDQDLARLSEDLRYCPPQAEGFFLQPGLPTETLEELLGADLVLLEDLENVSLAIEALPETPPRRKGMRKMLDDLQGSVRNLSAHLVHRDGILCRFGSSATGTDG